MEEGESLMDLLRPPVVNRWGEPTQPQCYLFNSLLVLPGEVRFCWVFFQGRSQGRVAGVAIPLLGLEPPATPSFCMIPQHSPPPLFEKS